MAGQPCSFSHGGATITEDVEIDGRAASSSGHLGGDIPVVETGEGQRSLMGKKKWWS
ncbi:hypothetical protein Tco_1528571, partial [Tanacetum coccineum]